MPHSTKRDRGDTVIDEPAAGAGSLLQRLAGIAAASRQPVLHREHAAVDIDGFAGDIGRLTAG